MATQQTGKLEETEFMINRGLERAMINNEAYVVVRSLRTTVRKLSFVVRQIRGKPVSKALADLSLSRYRVAKNVGKALQSAIANAENNHGLDVDRLIVSRVSVGPGLKIRRFRAAGRGRIHSYYKRFSNMEIVVREFVRGKN